MVKRALLVGIDEYQDDAVHDLRGCVNDIEAVAEVLVHSYGFDAANLSKHVTPADTTRNAILTALTELVQSTRNGDVALFYYSGHGSQVPDLDDDSKDGLDETIMPSDSGRGGLPVRDILDDELHSYIAALAQRTEHAYFVFDSCHSGSVDRKAITFAAIEEATGPVPRAVPAATLPMEEPRRLYPDAPDQAHAEGSRSGLIRQGGYLFIAGCEEHQTAKELRVDGKSRGVLSHALVKQLSAGGASVERIFARVSQEVRSKVSDQDPVLEGPQRLRSAPPFDPLSEDAGLPSEAPPAGKANDEVEEEQIVNEDPQEQQADETQNGDQGQGRNRQRRQYDPGFALAAAVGALLLLVLAVVGGVVVARSAFEDLGPTTHAAAILVLVLLEIGFAFAVVGAYLALLDARGRAEAAQEAVARVGEAASRSGASRGVVDSVGTQTTSALEAIGKMPTARAMIALGALIVGGATALAWDTLGGEAEDGAPEIVRQPAPASVKAGQPVLFRVVAGGEGLSYEWQRNGAPVSPARDRPALAIDPARLAEDQDTFTAIVSNDHGEAVSDDVQLTVGK